MDKEVTITTGEELIQFMVTEKLNSKEICELLEKALILFADETKPPEVLIQEFKEYWKNLNTPKNGQYF